MKIDKEFLTEDYSYLIGRTDGMSDCLSFLSSRDKRIVIRSYVDWLKRQFEMLDNIFYHNGSYNKSLWDKISIKFKIFNSDFSENNDYINQMASLLKPYCYRNYWGDKGCREVKLLNKHISSISREEQDLSSLVDIIQRQDKENTKEERRLSEEAYSRYQQEVIDGYYSMV